MIKLLSISILLVLPFTFLFGQGDLDEQQKIFYRNERTFGLSLTSNGYGVSYREGKRIDYLNKRLIELDISVVKSPKEIKLSNPQVQTGGNFVFGKLNSVIFIRGGYGTQHEIFTKADLGGVSIRYLFAGGPIVSVAKPIYYNVLYPTSGGSTYEVRQEKFDPDIHDPSLIYSKASFIKGLNELGFIPGLYVRGAIDFEFSKEDKVIQAVEIGTSIEAFPKKIPIMAADDNRAFFFTLFAGFRMGLVIDPYEPGSGNPRTIFFRK